MTATLVPRTSAKLRCAVPNERVTEGIVRDHLAQNGVPGQVVCEQSSDDPRIKRALARASKTGSGVGKPEFIVTVPDDPDLVIVVECKTDPKFHASATLDRPAQFAVDGVLTYAKHLSRDFDVIAIAVSGTDKRSLKVNTYRQLRGSLSYDELEDTHGAVTDLRPVGDYKRLLTFDPVVRRRAHDDLIGFSRDLHVFMRDYAKLSENEKPLAVSGVLLALRDDVFLASWRRYKVKDLADELVRAIEREIKAAVPQTTKQRLILQPYGFIATHPELNKRPARQADWPLRQLVLLIEEHVRPFLDVYRDVDVVGEFYGEFLRYSGGDKKVLGIVLTPRHITELFAKIASVTEHDTVVDTCCGSGGFLIAALGVMDATAHDDAARTAIRQHHLVGVEQQPQMFALAASNMILRGDGKANLYPGSCFEPKNVNALKQPDTKKHQRPNVGLINPPFSQRGDGLHELDFVETLLDVLRPGGLAVVLLPMSCAIEPNPVRERLLAHHTLVASVSLPNDLFDGVITVGLVFRAHEPHAQAPAPTWFAYWKDDGFVKRKTRGRIDALGRWAGIRDQWLTTFHNREVIPGQSVLQRVAATDEWTAEAYLEVDYSHLGRDDFERRLREYLIFEAVYDASE